MVKNVIARGLTAVHTYKVLSKTDNGKSYGSIRKAIARETDGFRKKNSVLQFHRKNPMEVRTKWCVWIFILCSKTWWWLRRNLQTQCGKRWRIMFSPWCCIAMRLHQVIPCSQIPAGSVRCSTQRRQPVNAPGMNKSGVSSQLSGNKLSRTLQEV